MKLFNQELTFENARHIIHALPESRRSTYVRLASKAIQNEDEVTLLAAKLYVWNGYLASVVDRLTGETEVLLRNFLDQHIGDWNASNSTEDNRDWLTNPTGVLKAIIHPQNGIALSQRANLSMPPDLATHDDYVAGLTFGSWVHLLPKNHAGPNNARVILWNEAISPHLADANRVAFQLHAMRAKEMRNRATHRRPLIKDVNSVVLTHQSCIELVSAIDENIGQWLRSERWVPDAIKLNPLKI